MNNSLTIHREEKRDKSILDLFLFLSLYRVQTICVYYDTNVSPSTHSVYVYVSGALPSSRSRSPTQGRHSPSMSVQYRIIRKKERKRERKSNTQCPDRRRTIERTASRTDCRRLEISHNVSHKYA
jgi:hypothetical protein